MKKRYWRYLIGVVTLVLLSTVTFVGCKKNTDEENVGTEGGLQEKEEGEMESESFDDLFQQDNQDDENNTDKGGTQNSNTNKQNGNGTSGVTEQNKPSSENSSQGSDSKNNGESTEDENQPMTGVDENTEEGWGPIIKGNN